MTIETSINLQDFSQRIEWALPAMGATDIRRDADGDFVFRHGGLSLLLALDDRDPGFIRVILPRFLEAQPGESRSQLLETCARTCAAVKLAKLFFVGDDLCATVEALAPNPESVDAVFIERLVSAAIASAAYVINAAEGREPEQPRRSAISLH